MVDHHHHFVKHLQNIRKWNKDFIRYIIDGRYQTLRSKRISKILSGDHSMNRFFHVTMPPKSREYAITFVSDFIGSHERKTLDERFSEGSFQLLVSEWLMPDIIIETIRHFDGNLTNLMIERALWNIVNEF